MNDKRTLTLAEKIKSQTEKGLLNWVRSSYVNSYRLSLGSGIITIDFTPEPIILSDNTVSPVFSFAIYNDRNEVIDMLSASETSDTHYNLLQQLYLAVEANYLKKDKTFQSMFDALDITF